MLGKRLRAPLVALILCLLACAPAAASPGLRLGLMDDALLTNRPDLAWPWIQQLVPQVLRYDVDWPLVAPVRPRNASNPLDPGYRWRSIDDVVMLARRQGIPVVLTIDHTPAWAGGGASHIRAPRHLLDLQRFAHAAATRYAGLVSRWTAWNEPNLPDSLQPQIRLVRGRIVPASPGVYAGMLRAIYDGVHQAGRERHVAETVAAGDTSPYGCGPRCKPASVAPLTFLRAVARLHAPFDVWAHHPYRILDDESPTIGNHDPQVSLGNIGDLVKTLRTLYPKRTPHIWLDELGYQTDPPDPYRGVSPQDQAAYLAQSVRVARRTPLVDMLVWFMLRDEADHGFAGAGGFQTGLVWDDDTKKPAFNVFAMLARQGGGPPLTGTLAPTAPPSAP